MLRDVKLVVITHVMLYKVTSWPNLPFNNCPFSPLSPLQLLPFKRVESVHWFTSMKKVTFSNAQSVNTASLKLSI